MPAFKIYFRLRRCFLLPVAFPTYELCLRILFQGAFGLMLETFTLSSPPHRLRLPGVLLYLYSGQNNN